MNRIKLHYTPAAFVAIVGAGITVAISFGVHMTQENTRSIMILVGLVSAGITVGGGLKSKGMLDAGIHPMQKAVADEQLQQTRLALRRIEDAQREKGAYMEDHLSPSADSLGVRVGEAAMHDAEDGGKLHVHVETSAPRRQRPYRGDAHEAHPLLKAYGSFAGLPLGKNEARIDPRTPMLAEFMVASAALGHRLPRQTHRFEELVGENGADFGMMGNDAYGDCTCAALGHAVQFWTGVGGGKPVTLTTAQILALYWATGTADDGRVMFEVLKYAQHNGIAGHPIGAYVGVGLRRYKHRDVRASIDLFGGCYLGVALPETAQQQAVWDVAGDPTKPGPAQWGSWGGHAIWGADYDHDGVDVVTWGHKQKLTWRFLDAYADEGYAVISPDWLHGGKTVEGIDLAGLNEYLAKIKSGYQPT